MRNGRGNVTVQDIETSVHSSLQRLNTDVIDLYQIHWPLRSVPQFGKLYFEPNTDHPEVLSIQQQLETLARFVKEGKIRYIGLSNETPYGIHEFVRIAEQYNLPRIVSTQNVYCLVNRSVENDLDESLHRIGVSFLAYSPLAFGLLTGKYDATGITGLGAPSEARCTLYKGIQHSRWGRDIVVRVAKIYNSLARKYGMTPTEMALAFCYTKWQVASTIIGVTSEQQLDQNLDIYGTVLDQEILQKIDYVRHQYRDLAY
jgi:aryl-alcohol dehydrogenase-like predicted oxidoreductase